MKIKCWSSRAYNNNQHSDVQGVLIHDTYTVNRNKHLMCAYLVIY
jgi:hypothetical protein